MEQRANQLAALTLEEGGEDEGDKEVYEYFQNIQISHMTNVTVISNFYIIYLTFKLLDSCA